MLSFFIPLFGAWLVHATPLVRPTAVANDNRVPAGTTVAGRRRIRLVAQQADWHPDSDDGPSLDSPVFGEEGKTPTVPGPLIRVRAGTAVDLSVRNTLADTLIVYAQCFGACKQRVMIAPGETKPVPVHTERAGTYTYASDIWRGGHVVDVPPVPMAAGAVVVDAPNAPPDRVFVLLEWTKPWDSTKVDGDARLVMTINGKMWPHTERLHAAVGDTLHWRVVNASDDSHPMHLHGFYFRVDSRGNGISDTIYSPVQQRRAVTEDLGPRQTMSLTWIPEREGNWVFHCHKAPHMSGFQHTDLSGEHLDPIMPQPHDAHMSDADHVMQAMGGLILGIDVAPRRGMQVSSASASVLPTSASTGVAKKFRLYVQQKPGKFGTHGYVLQNDSIPSRDSVQVPGPPLIITRGEPVEVTVINHLDSPTGVHWHGIELDSYYDGVAGWSGAANKLAPRVQPNDSFVVRFTPPRAGTFMYHSHAEEIRQIGLGLYAPLIVLEPGKTFDPDTDHPLMLGYTIIGEQPYVGVNGSPASYGINLKAGVTHRLRLMNMLLDEEADIVLVRDAQLAHWRVVAKDGADLPAAQRRLGVAKARIGPGETMDVEIAPAPGTYQLAFSSFSNVLITVNVR